MGRDKDNDRDGPRRTVFPDRLCVLCDLRGKDTGGGETLYKQGKCLTSEEAPTVRCF